MNAMKRVAIALCAVSLLAAALCGAAWVNNIFCSSHWSPKYVSEGAHGWVLKGPITWLDWTAVDVSTVTTFVPFAGFLMVSLGFLRLLRKEMCRGEYFPFFRTYNALNITLGLIGTIWGLIMIGFYDPTKIQMGDIIVCMNTALYSTLIAAVWVYTLANPLRFIMQRMRAAMYGEEDDADVESALASLLGAVKAMASGLSGAKPELDRFRESASAVSKVLADIIKALVEFKARFGIDHVASVASACNALNNAAVAMMATAAEQRKSAEEQTKAAKELLRILHEQKAATDAMAKRVEEALRLAEERERQRLAAVAAADQARAQKESADRRATAAEKSAAESQDRLRRAKELLS